ncbi:MAG: hypothetical protein R3B90_15715 [Planctomycetaceae bacterium]
MLAVDSVSGPEGQGVVEQSGAVQIAQPLAVDGVDKSADLRGRMGG